MQKTVVFWLLFFAFTDIIWVSQKSFIKPFAQIIFFIY